MSLRISSNDRRPGVGVYNASIKRLINTTKRGSKPAHAQLAWAKSHIARELFKAENNLSPYIL